MCTSIVEIVSADGAGKGGDGWFNLTHSVVSYDHPHHAVLQEAITIDFVNSALGPETRVAVELTLASRTELTAARGNRDMAHRRIGLGAVPMALAGLDVHDVADIDLALVVLGGDHAGARGHDQDLVAGMGVPTRRATLAEVHHAAVIVRRIP